MRWTYVVTYVICKKQLEPKRAGVAILIADGTNFKRKIVTRDKEEHFIIIKGSVHQKHVSIINNMWT